MALVERHLSLIFSSHTHAFTAATTKTGKQIHTKKGGKKRMCIKLNFQNSVDDYIDIISGIFKKIKRPRIMQ